MIDPLPLTFWVTCFGSPWYTIAPLPRTAASRLSVAVMTIRPDAM